VEKKPGGAFQLTKLADKAQINTTKKRRARKKEWGELGKKGKPMVPPIAKGNLQGGKTGA